MDKPDERNMFHSPGAARDDRLLKALDPSYFRVDARRLSDWLAFAARYARRLVFYDTDNRPAGSWEPLLNKDISVLLAELLTTDLEDWDRRINARLFDIQQQYQPEERRRQFGALLDDLYAAIGRMDTWYRQAERLHLWEEKTRLETEFERLIREELRDKWRELNQLVADARASGQLPEGYEPQRPGLHRVWAATESEPEPPAPRAERSWNIAVGAARQIYRRLFFALTYLLEIARQSFEQSITEKDDHAPHIGLLIAFLKLYHRYVQEDLNGLTGRHLDHYYYDVLRLAARPGQPDRTSVCFQLADHVREHYLPAGTRLLADVNDQGLESHYQTTAPLLVTRARVASLRTVFVSKNPAFRIGSSYRLISGVFMAPVADSADGKGAPFLGDDDSWPAFGEDQMEVSFSERRMDHARLGFALASPVLLLGEGEREITLRLHLAEGSQALLFDLLEDIRDNRLAEMRQRGLTAKPDDLLDAIFMELFRRSLDISISGETGWIPIPDYLMDAPGDWTAGEVSLRLRIPPGAPPVAGNNPDVLGESYDTPWPLLRVTINTDQSVYNYAFLRDLAVDKITIEVSVKGHQSLVLYNDLGQIDPSGVFLPFGPTPGRNAYFLIGSGELFRKRLRSIGIKMVWNNLPEEEGGFAAYYQAYDPNLTNDSFRVTLSALSEYDFHPLEEDEQQEFPLFAASAVRRSGLAPVTVLEGIDLQRLALRPDYHLAAPPEFSNARRSGFLRLKISGPDMAFGHARYPRLFSRAIAESARQRSFTLFPGNEDGGALPNEPFTPALRKLTLDYTAETSINLDPLQARENDLAADEKIFVLHPFGVDTLYAAGRAHDQYLLPRFDQDGYLYIGLQDLSPPQPLSIFFDIVESRRRPDETLLVVEWAYLHRDQWMPLALEQILSDTTADFTTSGIIALDLPADLTDDAAILPAGLHWLRVTARGNLRVVGRIRQVVAQAVEAVWVDNGDPAHFDPRAPLPSIREVVGQPGEIAAVRQPAPFVRGRLPEKKADFLMRVSERLRHKNRAVTRWDVERLVLEQFPDVYQVKCLGRLGNEAFLAPGEIRVVVLPRPDGADTEPRMGVHDLRLIREFLEERTTPFATLRVINPVYERIKVSCGVRFKKELRQAQGGLLRQLRDDLTRFICPWLDGGPVAMGGRISKNDVLTFIRDRPYVQFVTRFSMVQIFEEEDESFTLRDTAAEGGQSEILQASRPWSVLVPADRHQIVVVDTESYAPPELTAIEGMRLGTDFIVVKKDDAETLSPAAGDIPPPGEEDAEEFFAPGSLL